MLEKPQIKPERPEFSSGPVISPVGHGVDRSVTIFHEAGLEGRSHRSPEGVAFINDTADQLRSVLEIPDTHQIIFMNGSDTAAVEALMMNCLGGRPVDVLQWEAFGDDWRKNLKKWLPDEKLTEFTAEYGAFPDLTRVDFDNHDVVTVLNGTTSGVAFADWHRIPLDRKGLIILDATSGAGAQEIDWNRADAVTFSFQKIFGGEGGIGVIVVNERVIERIENTIPAHPLMKLADLAKDNPGPDGPPRKFNRGLYAGKPTNTISLLTMADFQNKLTWAENNGGWQGLKVRADENLRIVQTAVRETELLRFLCQDSNRQSNTTSCLSIGADLTPEELKRVRDGAIEMMVSEGVALDAKSYAKAPVGFRFWTGPTIEASDLGAVMPWVRYALEEQLDKVA